VTGDPSDAQTGSAIALADACASDIHDERCGHRRGSGKGDEGS
jgi:hypothetical protein